MWNFQRVRALAVSKLNASGLDLVTRMELARIYSIKEWFRPTMLKLALRKTVPTDEEGERIGWEKTFIIFQIREDVLPFRRRLLEKAVADADRYQDYLNSERYCSCPFCGMSIVKWQIKAADAKTEAKNVKAMVALHIVEGSEKEKANAGQTKAKTKSQQPRRSSPPMSYSRQPAYRDSSPPPTPSPRYSRRYRSPARSFKYRTPNPVSGCISECCSSACCCCCNSDCCSCC